jgi:hypothetical protein
MAENEKERLSAGAGKSACPVASQSTELFPLGRCILHLKQVGKRRKKGKEF